MHKPGISHLLRHLARKHDGLFLIIPEPSTGRTVYGLTVYRIDALKLKCELGTMLFDAFFTLSGLNFNSKPLKWRMCEKASFKLAKSLLVNCVTSDFQHPYDFHGTWWLLNNVVVTSICLSHFVKNINSQSILFVLSFLISILIIIIIFVYY